MSAWGDVLPGDVKPRTVGYLLDGVLEGIFKTVVGTRQVIGEEARKQVSL